MVQVEEKVPSLHLIQREIAERSFEDFLGHVKVQDPPPGLGLRPFEMWPYVKDAARIIVETKFLAVLKTRQIGWTTLLAAYALWLCYKDHSRISLLSIGEDEAEVFLEKCKVMWEQLPAHLRIPRSKRDNLDLMEFQNDSRIEALSSTSKSGRSTTGSLVVMDEADFHEYFGDNFEAIKPTVEEGRRQLFVVSTSDWKTIDSDFKRTWRQARPEAEVREFEKHNPTAPPPFLQLFYPYNVRPGRDDGWRQAAIDSSTNKEKSQKEYATSAEEALAPPDTIRSFSVDMVEYMRQFVRPPIEKNRDTEIFTRYQPRHRYVMASDTGGGVGGDWSVTGILDIDMMSIVAHVMSRFLDGRGLAMQSLALAEMYANPWWIIETNGIGITTYNYAAEERYHRLYDDEPGNLNRRGWYTGPSSRPLLWEKVIGAVDDGALRIPSEEGLNQFGSVVRVMQRNKRNNSLDIRHEASGGANDDYPMMVALAVNGMGKVPHQRSSSRPGQTSYWPSRW